jgi:hypothetical protein
LCSGGARAESYLAMALVCPIFRYPAVRVVFVSPRAGDWIEQVSMPDMTMPDKTALLIGSGPNALNATAWPRTCFDDIVAINNAWRVRPDWTHLVHPEDFPEDRRPEEVSPEQKIVDYRDYVPVQNALGAIRPAVMGFIGCDMVYPAQGQTHFYGTGTADPLRVDISLRNLEAKSARLFLLAAEQGCLCVNLSQDTSRLVFPRATIAGLRDMATRHPVLDQQAIRAAKQEEARLGYFVESGRYWQVQDRFDPACIDALDALWLAAFEASSRQAT